MINVIRKERAADFEKLKREMLRNISRTTFSLRRGFSAAAKQELLISYDTEGRPSVDLVDLGQQFDHQVTWLKFDFEKMLWNGVSEEERANHYQFKIHFIPGKGEENYAEIFDPFEPYKVPRDVTKRVGKCEIAVSIQELMGEHEEGDATTDDDFNEGNIFTKQEVFVTEAFKGAVKAAKAYDSGMDEKIEALNEQLAELSDNDLKTLTDQLRALTKKPIEGVLNDLGDLALDQPQWGVKYDQYVKYIRFNPQHISSHLEGTSMFGIFRKKDDSRLAYISAARKIDSEDIFDNYDSEQNSWIIWLPVQMFEADGKWNFEVVAYNGSLRDLDKDTSVYVSKTATGVVKNSKINWEDLEDTAEEMEYPTFLTADNKLIVTYEREYFYENDDDEEIIVSE